MHGISRCAICGFHEAVDGLESVLGTGPACFECIESRAERPEIIHQAAAAAYKLAPTEKERVRSIAYLKTVNCWAGPEDGYMPLAKYEERISRQMPVMVDPDEAADLEAIMAAQKRIKEQMAEFERTKTKKASWWRVAIDFLFPRFRLA